MARFLFVSIAALSAMALPQAAQAQPSKGKINTDEMVDKGLEYLKRSQNPDGHWDGGGGSYPTVMTGLAGMAMLMEGSTLREGKYSDNLVKAVSWFLGRSQNNGLLGNPQNPTESSRYIYGHGFGLLFLSCVYGEEEDDKRRKQLEAVIKKAVEFSGKAQTKHGGWGLGLRFRGFPGWFVTRSYHLFQLPLVSRKLRVVADWTTSLFFRRDTAELSMLGHPHRLGE